MEFFSLKHTPLPKALVGTCLSSKAQPLPLLSLHIFPPQPPQRHTLLCPRRHGGVELEFTENGACFQYQLKHFLPCDLGHNNSTFLRLSRLNYKMGKWYLTQCLGEI